MARTREKAKKREQPLGAAIGWGLATILIVGILIATVLFLIPGTAAHNFVRLVHYNTSATLPLDPLYQEWAEKISEEDTLFGTPLSLLCGGLVLGWLAPSYVYRRRVLLSGAALGFGVLLVALGFEWIAAVTVQTTLNAHEGGEQVQRIAPPELILWQTLSVSFSIAVCVLGTWLGLKLRDRSRTKQALDIPSPRPVTTSRPSG